MHHIRCAYALSRASFFRKYQFPLLLFRVSQRRTHANMAQLRIRNLKLTRDPFTSIPIAKCPGGILWDLEKWLLERVKVLLTLNLRPERWTLGGHWTRDDTARWSAC